MFFFPSIGLLCVPGPPAEGRGGPAQACALSLLNRSPTKPLANLFISFGPQPNRPIPPPILDQAQPSSTFSFSPGLHRTGPTASQSPTVACAFFPRPLSSLGQAKPAQ